MTVETARILTAVIPAGQSLSGEVLAEGGALTRIELPAAWDAAPITLQVDSGGGFKDLLDAETNTEIRFPASGNLAAGKAYAIPDAGKLGKTMKLKLRSGTSAAPVNQTAERSITVVVWLG